MKIIGAVLVAVALALGAVAPAQAEQADAEFPFQLGVQGSYGTSSVAVAIPEGASPVQLTGTVVSTYLETGSLVFTVNGGRTAPDWWPADDSADRHRPSRRGDHRGDGGAGRTDG